MFLNLLILFLLHFLTTTSGQAWQRTSALPACSALCSSVGAFCGDGGIQDVERHIDEDDCTVTFQTGGDRSALLSRTVRRITSNVSYTLDKTVLSDLLHRYKQVQALKDRGVRLHNSILSSQQQSTVLHSVSLVFPRASLLLEWLLKIKLPFQRVCCTQECAWEEMFRGQGMPSLESLLSRAVQIRTKHQLSGASCRDGSSLGDAITRLGQLGLFAAARDLKSNLMSVGVVNITAMAVAPAMIHAYRTALVSKDSSDQPSVGFFVTTLAVIRTIAELQLHVLLIRLKLAPSVTTADRLGICMTSSMATAVIMLVLYGIATAVLGVLGSDVPDVLFTRIMLSLPVLNIGLMYVCTHVLIQWAMAATSVRRVGAVRRRSATAGAPQRILSPQGTTSMSRRQRRLSSSTTATTIMEYPDQEVVNAYSSNPPAVASISATAAAAAYGGGSGSGRPSLDTDARQARVANTALPSTMDHRRLLELMMQQPQHPDEAVDHMNHIYEHYLMPLRGDHEVFAAQALHLSPGNAAGSSDLIGTSSGDSLPPSHAVHAASAGQVRLFTQQQARQRRTFAGFGDLDGNTIPNAALNRTQATPRRQAAGFDSVMNTLAALNPANGQELDFEGNTVMADGLQSNRPSLFGTVHMNMGLDPLSLTSDGWMALLGNAAARQQQQQQHQQQQALNFWHEYNQQQQHLQPAQDQTRSSNQTQSQQAPGTGGQASTHAARAVGNVTFASAGTPAEAAALVARRAAARAALAAVHWPAPLELASWLEDSPNIPDAFRCPITLSLMREPTQASSGVTYDRSAIFTWLQVHKVDPVTQAPLKRHRLIPNLNLRHMIEEWAALQTPPDTQDGGGGGGVMEKGVARVNGSDTGRVSVATMPPACS